METFTQHLMIKKPPAKIKLSLYIKIPLCVHIKAYRVIEKTEVLWKYAMYKISPHKNIHTRHFIQYEKKRESQSFLLPETACIATIQGQNLFRLLCCTTKEISDKGFSSSFFFFFFFWF